MNLGTRLASFFFFGLFSPIQQTHGEFSSATVFPQNREGGSMLLRIVPEGCMPARPSCYVTDAALGLGISWLGWALCVTSIGQWMVYSRRDRRVPQHPSCCCHKGLVERGTLCPYSDSKGVGSMLVTIHRFSGLIIISCVFIHFKKLALLSLLLCPLPQKSRGGIQSWNQQILTVRLWDM